MLNIFAALGKKSVSDLLSGKTRSESTNHLLKIINYVYLEKFPCEKKAEAFEAFKFGGGEKDA